MTIQAQPGMDEISIHALREEGDRPQLRQHHQGPISIHALREEGDKPAKSGGKRPGNFYPRPPRGGRLAALRA